MSKILTNFKDSDDDEEYLINDKNSDFDIRESINEKQHKNTDGINETIIDVSVNNTKNNLLVYFNCVELDENDKAGKYTTRTYSLSPKTGTLGLFDFLDDYFLRRIKFFNSSKTVQAFMYALVQSERIFKKRSGFSLFEYCAEVTGNSLNDTLHCGKFKNGLKCKLWNGYEMRDEARFFLDKKRKYLNMEYMEELGNNVIKFFLKNMKYITTKHFVGVCVNITDDLPPSLFIDPFLGLPLIVYIPEFAEILITKVAHSFLETEEFKKADITHIVFEIYLLMPEATLETLKASYKTDGELKDYEGFEEKDFIIGKYKNYDVIEAEIDENEFDSIICYS